MGPALIEPRLEARLCEEFGYAHAVLFGRARSALVALLEALDAHAEFTVPIPSNVCPELLVSVLSCGAKPELLAVDPTNGLVADEALAAAVRRGKNGLAIATQLYGFRQAHPATTRAAREQGWFLLESDTLLTGARSVSGGPHPFADAVLVSFGYSKTIDCGGGALLLNDNALASELRRKARAYPPLDAAAVATEARLMALRRQYRAHLEDAPSDSVAGSLLQGSLAGLRFGFPSERAAPLAEALDRLGRTAVRRRELAETWDRVLRPVAPALAAPSLTATVPWRVIRRIPHGRETIVAALRAAGFDAGTNYPSLADTYPQLFDNGPLVAAREWGMQVINLWVTEDYDADRIIAAGSVIRRALDRTQ